jgi:glutaconate CoA-transferase subunit A
VVPRERIVADAHRTKVPGYYVEAVVEAPFGAHPTSHVPAYPQDAWELMDYAAVAGGEGLAGYVERLRTEDEGRYRARVLGGDRARVLRALVDQAQVLEVPVS